MADLQDLAGERYCYLTTIGRRSGRPREIEIWFHLEGSTIYMLAEGNPSRPRCINLVALKRNNFSAETIRALAEAHRLLYRAKVGLDHARELLRAADMLVPAVNHLLNFLQNQHEGRNGRGRDRRRAA